MTAVEPPVTHIYVVRFEDGTVKHYEAVSPRQARARALGHSIVHNVSVADVDYIGQGRWHLVDAALTDDEQSGMCAAFGGILLRWRDELYVADRVAVGLGVLEHRRDAVRTQATFQLAAWRKLAPDDAAQFVRTYGDPARWGVDG